MAKNYTNTRKGLFLVIILVGFSTITFSQGNFISNTNLKMVFWHYDDGRKFQSTVDYSIVIIASNSLHFYQAHVYPTGTKINTLTYKPGVGPASITDQTGLPKFYQYDSKGRPIAILDHQRNVLANHVYHYKRNP